MSDSTDGRYPGKVIENRDYWGGPGVFLGNAESVFNEGTCSAGDDDKDLEMDDVVLSAREWKKNFLDLNQRVEKASLWRQETLLTQWADFLIIRESRL